MNSRKNLALAATASVMALGLMAGAAQAQVATSGSVGFYSDYRLRGVSQTDKNLAIQGSIEAAVPVSKSVSLFAGVWASSLDKDVGFGSLETDLYVGAKGKVGDLGWTAKYLRLVYVDQDNVDFDQYAGELSYPIGPVSATLGVVRDEYQGSGHSTYVYGGGAYSFANTPVSVHAQLGYEDGTGYNNKYNWDIGGTYAFQKLSLSLDYIDTNKDVFFPGLKDNQAGSTVLGTISASF